MHYPAIRLRRMRRNEQIRAMVRETRLTVDQLIYPLFVCTGENVRHPISSMPGCFQMSVDKIVEECREINDLGIPAVILFGIPDKKDEFGTGAYDPEGPVPVATRAIKKAFPNLQVWADVCMCEYTSHGHCGIVSDRMVENDPTLDLLAKAALTYVQAGADVVAPSDMMDGRVARIRETLEEAGYCFVPIVSYAAKYSSAFYGPFREAAESAPQFGDRRSYQMDPANTDEAMREVAFDIDEGADIVMVKPALPYLDIIRRVKDEFNIPIAAYNVSGEYSMLHAAAEKGWLDYEKVMMESLLSIRRAGATMILTYFAKDAARVLARQ
ncbi:porphobilinogen synthase [bacterium]|nr:porphobilinogen synthase [bacterium]